MIVCSNGGFVDLLKHLPAVQREQPAPWTPEVTVEVKKREKLDQNQHQHPKKIDACGGPEFA